MKKNIKILIVEDSKTQAEELKYFLETNYYQVQHADTYLILIFNS
jgi:DNA-binding response OmpR family regulator